MLMISGNALVLPDHCLQELLQIDTIDYVQIMSTGNAVDFGNLIAGNQQSVGCSNGHGGLG